MNIALVAGVWLLLGVIFCLVSGRSVAGDPADVEPAETPVEIGTVSDASRQFIGYPVHAWALVAHNLSMDELLTTHPGSIRRVAAK